MNSWKSVLHLTWTDELYDQIIKYKQNTSNIPESLTPKARSDFKKKANVFILAFDVNSGETYLQYEKSKNDDNEILFVDNIIKYKVIRPSQRDSILDFVTNGKNIQHLTLSTRKIYDRILKTYKIIGITEKYIDNYLKQKADGIRADKQPGKLPIIKSYRPKRPRQHWQIDTFHIKRKHVKIKLNNYDYFLVIIDIFSKFIYIKPLASGSPDGKKDTIKSSDKSSISSQTANFLETIFLTGDIPKIIQSDNGSEFEGKVQDLFRRYNIKHILTPSYRPQANGFVENKNRLIKSMIYTFITNSTKYKDYSIPDILNKIAFAINSSIQSVTKLTPISIHFGINELNQQNDDMFQEVKKITETKKGTLLDFDKNNAEPKTIEINSLNSPNLEQNIEYEDVNGEKFSIELPKNNDLKEYENTTRKLNVQRNKVIATRISNNADKAEVIQLKNADKRLISINSFVKIKTFYKIPDKLGDQPIYIKYESEIPHSLSEPKPPFDFQDEQAVKSKSRFVERTYPQIYKVTEKIITSDKQLPAYKVKPLNYATGKIEHGITVKRKIQKKQIDGKIPTTDKFYATELHVIDSSQVIQELNEFTKKKKTVPIKRQVAVENENEEVKNIPFYIKEVESIEVYRQYGDDILIEKIIYKDDMYFVLKFKFKEQNNKLFKYFYEYASSNGRNTKYLLHQLNKITNKHTSQLQKDIYNDTKIQTRLAEHVIHVHGEGIITAVNLKILNKTRTRSQKYELKKTKPYTISFQNGEELWFENKDIQSYDFEINRSVIADIFRYQQYKRPTKKNVETIEKILIGQKIKYKQTQVETGTIIEKINKHKNNYNWKLDNGITIKLNPINYSKQLANENDWCFTDESEIFIREQYIKYILTPRL